MKTGQKVIGVSVTDTPTDTPQLTASVNIVHRFGARFGGSITTPRGVTVGDFPFNEAITVEQLGVHGLVISDELEDGRHEVKY